MRIALVGLLVAIFLAGCDAVFDITVDNRSQDSVIVVADWWGAYTSGRLPGYRVPANSVWSLQGPTGVHPTGKALVYRATDCALLGQTEFSDLATMLITIPASGAVEFDIGDRIETSAFLVEIDQTCYQPPSN
jgi:hypothetical protein